MQQTKDLIKITIPYMMVDIRVCIPRKYQKQLLNELHTAHFGIVKMKILARSTVS